MTKIIRSLMYGGFAIIAINQSLGAGSVDHDGYNSTSAATTPARRNLSTSDMSPPQDPTTRIASLPEANATFGNFKFSTITSWYTKLSNGLVSFFTRYEAYKKQIKTLDAEVKRLTALSEQLGKDNAALRAQLSEQTKQISSLERDKGTLLERFTQGSERGSIKSKKSHVGRWQSNVLQTDENLDLDDAKVADEMF
ncbi:MAG: hypothetical protein KBD31_04390 [Proteobacteria bacterium]|nr:hypothetical protein [Pseudomonadota bacterium]